MRVGVAVLVQEGGAMSQQEPTTERVKAILSRISYAAASVPKAIHRRWCRVKTAML